MLKIDWPSAGALAPALREIAAEMPDRFDASGGDLVSFAPLHGGAAAAFSVERRETGWRIGHAEPAAALRGLALLLDRVRRGERPGDFGGASPFPVRGVMIDASRNAVPKLDTLKLYLRRMALMGLNRLLLYCEDTYEIPSEPFFGYFRGRYTQAELREIDDYAFALGIEVVLCLQTLGHLEKVLQWPRFAGCRDTAGVLLADTPEVYALIGRMLDAAAASLRSRRVHIGMDEAHGIGSGRYREKFGLRRPFDILLSHLQMVTALCRERGLEPMIWSDMFFRLGSKANDYYDLEAAIPPEVPAQIPPDVTLVYWDYYHRETGVYDRMIDGHRALGAPPAFATGIWSWSRFWTSMHYTLASMGPGMEAARRHGLREVFATAWGDNGGEVDLLSTLMGAQYFAELCFGAGEEEAARRFETVVGADWGAWKEAGELDRPDRTKPWGGNDSKRLLWADPLLGFLDAEMGPGDDRFGGIARALERHPDDFHLEVPRRLARALELKCALHRRLRPAYRARDLARLARIAREEVPAASAAVRALHEAHRALWTRLYKPFGWEILDLRYGGLLARLETLRATLERFLDDPAQPIAELDAEPLPLRPQEDFHPGILWNYGQAASPSSA